MSRKMNGVTLVELMITIGIAAVLLMIAVPSFQSYTGTQKLRSISADLTSALNIARSEAAKRNANVTISAKNGDWTDGWTVAISGGGTTIADFPGYESVAFTVSNSATSLEYGNNGRLSSASAVSFEVNVDPSVSGVSARCVQVSLSGKPKTDVGGC